MDRINKKKKKNNLKMRTIGHFLNKLTLEPHLLPKNPKLLLSIRISSNKAILKCFLITKVMMKITRKVYLVFNRTSKQFLSCYKINQLQILRYKITILRYN